MIESCAFSSPSFDFRSLSAVQVASPVWVRHNFATKGPNSDSPRAANDLWTLNINHDSLIPKSPAFVSTKLEPLPPCHLKQQLPALLPPTSVFTSLPSWQGRLSQPASAENAATVLKSPLKRKRNSPYDKVPYDNTDGVLISKDIHSINPVLLGSLQCLSLGIPSRLCPILQEKHVSIDSAIHRESGLSQSALYDLVHEFHDHGQVIKIHSKLTKICRQCRRSPVALSIHKMVSDVLDVVHWDEVAQGPPPNITSLRNRSRRLRKLRVLLDDLLEITTRARDDNEIVDHVLKFLKIEVSTQTAQILLNLFVTVSRFWLSSIVQAVGLEERPLTWPLKNSGARLPTMTDEHLQTLLNHVDRMSRFIGREQSLAILAAERQVSADPGLIEKWSLNAIDLERTEITRQELVDKVSCFLKSDSSVFVPSCSTMSDRLFGARTSESAFANLKELRVDFNSLQSRALACDEFHYAFDDSTLDSVGLIDIELILNLNLGTIIQPQLQIVDLAVQNQLLFRYNLYKHIELIGSICLGMNPGDWNRVSDFWEELHLSRQTIDQSRSENMLSPNFPSGFRRAISELLVDRKSRLNEPQNAMQEVQSDCLDLNVTFLEDGQSSISLTLKELGPVNFIITPETLSVYASILAQLSMLEFNDRAMRRAFHMQKSATPSLPSRQINALISEMRVFLYVIRTSIRIEITTCWTEYLRRLASLSLMACECSDSRGSIRAFSVLHEQVVEQLQEITLIWPKDGNAVLGNLLGEMCKLMLATTALFQVSDLDQEDIAAVRFLWEQKLCNFRTMLRHNLEHENGYQQRRYGDRSLENIKSQLDNLFSQQ